MPTYAVKLGDVMLVSDEPLTADERTKALHEMRALLARRGNGEPILSTEAGEVIVRLDAS